VCKAGVYLKEHTDGKLGCRGAKESGHRPERGGAGSPTWMRSRRVAGLGAEDGPQIQISWPRAGAGTCMGAAGRMAGASSRGHMRGHYQKYCYRCALSEAVLHEPHLKHYQHRFISSCLFQLLGAGISVAVLHVEQLLIIL
jgi:hypothetical protein